MTRTSLLFADLERALRGRVDGEVRFDSGSRAAYSTDASNYRQVPIGVVVPRTPGGRGGGGGGVPRVRRASTLPRRRNQPGRAVLQHRCRARLDQVLHPDRVGRRYRRSRCRRTRHRPRLSQRSNCRHRLDGRPEALDSRQLHDRRDDRQQLLRIDRPGVREDGRFGAPPGGAHLRRAPDVGRGHQRPRPRGDHRRRRSPRRDLFWIASPAGHRGRGDPRSLSAGSLAASRVTTSIPCCPRTIFRLPGC